MSEDKPSLGAYFKQEREKKGLDLKTIEARTKISAQTLQFLEDDRLEVLPPKAFVRGFIQVIAREFGLDARGLLERLEETLPDDDREPYVLELDEHPRLGRRGRWLVALILLAVALLSLGFCVWQSGPDAETVSAGIEMWYQQDADGRGRDSAEAFAA